MNLPILWISFSLLLDFFLLFLLVISSQKGYPFCNMAITYWRWQDTQGEQMTVFFIFPSNISCEILFCLAISVKYFIWVCWKWNEVLLGFISNIASSVLLIASVIITEHTEENCDWYYASVLFRQHLLKTLHRTNCSVSALGSNEFWILEGTTTKYLSEELFPFQNEFHSYVLYCMFPL